MWEAEDSKQDSQILLTEYPLPLQFKFEPYNHTLEDRLMSDTTEAVKSVINEVLKIDTKDVKPETRFIEDLKADSMDQFFLIDGFCEKFDIAISDEDARKIKTVQDAVSYIDQHKK
jgi:acyl carrier protein